MRRLLLVGVAVGALAASALPAFGAGSGLVPARVVATPADTATCILITSPAPPSAVDFGEVPFSTDLDQGLRVGTGTPDITVESCSASVQTLLAFGTDATGPAGSNAHWSLGVEPGAPCASNLDRYVLALNALQLTKSGQTAATLADLGSTASWTPFIGMPCTGSTGEGVTMSMSYLFTTTVP